MHDAGFVHGDLSRENFGKIGNNLVALGKSLIKKLKQKFFVIKHFPLSVDYGTTTEIANPKKEMYVKVEPAVDTKDKKTLWPYGIKASMSENAMRCGVRGISDDWWAFYCIGHQLHDENYEDDGRPDDEKIRIPWDYDSIQNLWYENSEASAKKAIDDTLKLHKKYPNLSVRQKMVLNF